MSAAEQLVSAGGLLDGPTLRDSAPTLAVLLLVGAGEVAALALARLDAAAWWELALVHAAAVGCVAAWTWTRRRSGLDSRLSAVALLGVAACGPFGAAGAWITFSAHAIQHRSSHGRSRGTRSSIPAAALTPESPALRVGNPAEESANAPIASFNDVMALGSIEEKRAAIALLTTRFRPEFTPALKRALRDPDPAVRVQAATAASRLENQFQRRVRELEAEADAGGPEARVALGDYLDEVAGTGLLDESRAALWRERALELYRSALPERLAQVALPIGRALVRLGREQEACEWFDGPAASIPASSHMLFWRLEAMYRAGRYRELRGLCQEHRDLLQARGVAPEPLRQAAMLWGACA